MPIIGAVKGGSIYRGLEEKAAQFRQYSADRQQSIRILPPRPIFALRHDNEML